MLFRSREWYYSRGQPLKEYRFLHASLNIPYKYINTIQILDRKIDVFQGMNVPVFVNHSEGVTFPTDDRFWVYPTTDGVFIRTYQSLLNTFKDPSTQTTNSTQ